METLTQAQTNTAIAQAPATPHLACQVVMLYEDLAAARSAQDGYEHLLAHLDLDTKAACSLWKFNLLQNPKLAALAAAEASAAQMIIVALHGSQDLPDEVKSWLELWLSHPERRALTLVLLCARHTENYLVRETVRTHLQNFAHRGGMDFIAEILEH